MARLPIPGGDNGDWGDILNDFLSQAHNQDGTLKQDPIIAEAKSLADSSIQSINGLTPTAGEITLNAEDVGAITHAEVNRDYLPAFKVDAYASVSEAYSALVNAGGGRLVFSPGVTYTDVNLTLNQAIPTEVYGQGAIIKPASGQYAFTLNAGRSHNQIISINNLTIDCSSISGSGIKIVDHYGASIKSTRILSPMVGILITDSSGWSEASQLDGIYIKSPSGVGIDIKTNGGTGSFGYANWGFVHIDNVPSGAIGMRCGANASISNSTISRLVIHSSSDSAVGMRVAGDLGLNTVINAVVESLSASMSSAIAIDIESTGTFDGCDFNLNIIVPSGGGGWGTKINNPSSRPIQLRSPRNFKVGGTSTSPIEQSSILGDSQPMFSRSADGTMRWGPGGSTATDAALSRIGVGSLLLNGGLQINSGNLNPFGGFRLASGVTTGSGNFGTGSAPLVMCDATSTNITRNLYNTTSPGYTYIVTKVDNTSNSVNIAPPASGTINGASSPITLTSQGDVALLFSTAVSGAWIGKKL